MGILNVFKKREQHVAEEALQAFKQSEDNLRRVASRWNEVRRVSDTGRSFISEYEDILRKGS